MVEESQYCSDVMKKHFNKELLIIIKGNGTLENSTKCWICNNDYIETGVKVRDHCCITGKYRGSAHRDCNIILRKLCASLWELTILLETKINTKKIHPILEFNQSQWLEPYIEFNTKKQEQKEIKTEKNTSHIRFESITTIFILTLKK